MRRTVEEYWRLAFTPPDRRPIEEWASENIELPPVLTKRGKFSIADSRHFAGPLAAIRHDRVRGIRVLKPVRGGGTLIADVAVPWGIVTDNASVLFLLQDQSIAEAHAETRTMPMLESVPSIAPMLPLDRHKKRKANILFSNGLPLDIRGPALGGLQSRGFKWVVCDEPWLYKPGVLTQAKARLGDFVKIAASKFIAISQGGEEDSEWDLEVRAAVLFVWKPECAACERPIELEWKLKRADGSRAGVVYDTVRNADNSYDKDATAATVRYVCPHCGHEHPNSAKTRAEWNRTGDYYHAKTGERFDPANPPSEVAFRWHALVDYPWGELVKEWLAAQEAVRVGNYTPLVNFFQKRCALMRSERSVHDAELPFARAKIDLLDPKEKAWPEEVARFLTADRQSEDVYWVTVRAWAKTGESRRLWFGRLYSEVDIEAKRAEFNVPADCTVVDSGYRPKGDHGVYSACIRYGWIAVKGADEPFFWHPIVRTVNGQKVTERVMKPWAPLTFGDPGEGTSEQGRRRCPLIRFSAGAMADRVMGLIDRGLWVEPEADETNELESEYRRQMSAEFKRPKVDKFTGKRVMVWVCPSGNNHAFDDAKMQVLCAMQAGLIPSGIELTAPPPPPQHEATAA
jgi:hypothetical protein